MALLPSSMESFGWIFAPRDKTAKSHARSAGVWKGKFRLKRMGSEHLEVKWGLSFLKGGSEIRAGARPRNSRRGPRRARMFMAFSGGNAFGGVPAGGMGSWIQTGVGAGPKSLLMPASLLSQRRQNPG